MKSGVYQFLVGCFAALGSFLFGYDLGVIAEVVISDDFANRFLQTNGDSRSGTVVALFTAGCFCGAFLASFSDPLGRRGAILTACCIFVVGGIIQTAGVVIAMLYVGRLIAGIGVGILTMIIPIYQAELAHRKIRGKITSLQQLFNALESPRWLCDHDRADSGLQTLAELHAHGDTNDPYVLAEYDLILAQIAEEHSHKKATYLDLFRGWPNVRRSILTMAIQVSCQMTGVSAIQYFSPQIFAQIGISTSLSLLFQAVNAIVALLGSATCVLAVDRVGRRPLEIYGCAFLCVTFIINAAIIKVFPTTSNNTGAHWAFVVLTWLFNYVFFLTSGPLSWAIPAELFGTAMRLKGVSLGAMASFASNTMIGQVTPIAISAIGWKYYIVFIVCNLTNALFFWAFLPETKGLNLEDMDELFQQHPVFVPGSKWLPSSHVDDEAQEIAKHGHKGYAAATVADGTVDYVERAV
ncbi:general substrate transporter [Hortaea werneckii]|nr:general substrate transporter [Hortaea werneckii]KAI7108853.1 general substrate transporter [Hortaea werneckii]KAI7245711.1 general substrate transporter [Hortaea werneckii]KAI7298992.1 general substrate transporter [Hortaea werneckii]KAI7390116.1 general substrate transporter [Hortaea werneckii]